MTQARLEGRREYRRLLDRFAAEVPDSLETLRGAEVQRWVRGKLSGDDALDAKTLNKWLGALRSYWDFLIAYEYMPQPDQGGQLPFHNRKVTNTHEFEIRKVEPDRYEPAAVVKLWQAAANDAPLEAMIRIAAYTGARWESIC